MLVAVTVAACESSTTIPSDKLSKLVLSEQDLPAGFASFYSGSQVRLDNQGTVRSDASRYGREGGWIIRLRRSDQTATAGPLVVESRADLFKDSGGAKSDLAAYRVLFSRTSGGDLKTLVVSGVGDETLGITFIQAGGRTLRYYRIAWRYRNATASILVEGFDGELTLAEALALARKQDKRIAGA